jgi:cell division inhibitor SepF
MSTLYRLKAYFGMVPAEDMDAYLDYDDEPGYYEDPRPSYPEPRAEYHQEPRPEYRQERAEYRQERHVADRYRPEDRQLPEVAPTLGPTAGVRGPATHGGTGRSPLVHGSLAVEQGPDDAPRTALVPPTAAQAPEAFTPSVPSVRSEPSEPRRVSLSRITTVHPRSYNEARTIGERYRDGIPVIMNLTELDDAAAKRLVDFAAGLAFALRGSIDKVTSRVFLLSPDGVDVSAEDRRKLAEGSFFGQD